MNAEDQAFVTVPEVIGTGRDGAGFICRAHGSIQPTRIVGGAHYAVNSSLTPRNAPLIAAWVHSIFLVEMERVSVVDPSAYQTVIDAMRAQLEKVAVPVVAAHMLANETAAKITERQQQRKDKAP